MSNKNILLSVLIITMLALSAGVAWADEEASTDSSGSVVKWQQPPDMKYGVNIQSTEVEPIVADDWRCEDPRPVTDVRFWGSYIEWETKNEKPQSRLPGVIGFVIRIYEDVPAGVDQRYSHPGNLLYEEKVEEFEENYVASILHPDETYEHKFYYSMDLPEPFEQKEGTIYWISITAIMPDEHKYPWGWETSTRHWNDNACGSVSGGDPWDWDEITPGMLPQWYPHETVDMAFELTVGSESPPIKWQQRPDMVQGINVISLVDDDNPKSMTVADDWLCLDGSPVTDLRFWGSYPGWYPDKVPRDPNTPPGIKEFKVQIYSDVPAVVGGEGFSRPGNLLYEVWVDDFTETYVDSILLPWEKYEHKYRYDIDLPEPFPQKRGTIYWLNVAARPHDHTYPWGWESSVDRWNDFAVQGWYADQDNSEWDLIYHPWTKRHIDMAFELTTGEGPMKWLQFPDMADGVNILSLPENPVVADDWLCTDGKPITEVHFWGSYLSREGENHWDQKNPGPPSPPPGVSEFKFSFHKDIPAGTDPEMPWSHPGVLIREVRMAPDEVKERYWDSVPHTDVQGVVWWEHKFYCIAPLKEPFKQEKGTIYWLDIGAKPVDDEWYWGWETSINHWNDNAVRGWNDGSWWECLGTASIDFEDLTLETEYKVGDTFTTSDIPVAVEPFQWSGGDWTSDGGTRVEKGEHAGGSGNEMNVNNVNLDFGFGTPIKRLSLLFGEYGGNLNIEVNGDFRNFNKFADINGLTIGGVYVTVVDLGDSKGRLILTGTTEQFALGGQELWIDDVEFVKRVDMAFALMTETVTSKMDWGDAPDGVTAPGYPTLATSNGASHIIDPDVFLGRWVEADEDGQPSADAIGDDIIDGNDDEDGVAIPPLRVGATTRIKVSASVSGYLNAWFDWDADGDWDDEGEYVIAERPILAGPSLHNIRVPGDAKPGGSYARFRFSTRPLTAVLPEPLYEGIAPDGEVEDYRFHVQPAGPDHFEPNDDFTTAFDLGSLNQDRTGLGIHEPGGEDWFEWTALNDGPVNFSVNGNVTLELYDSDGNKLATAGPDKCIPWDVTADTSYRVRIRATDPGMTILDYGWLVKLLGDSDNYALLFSGGSTPSYNYNRYYNNIKEMYETVVDDYDVPPDNIWILYADGTDPAADQPGGVNSDMSYIVNGTTVMPGTRANLESVLTTTLPGLVDGNDHFLFYAFDHGGGADNAPATTGEEVLTGWSVSTADNDLKDWLNQVGAGHATIVHTQCFAGGMLDDLLPLTSSTFGCAATNHYESSWGDGFAGAYADALKSGYGNAYDAYVYAHDHDSYAITLGTYPDNGGTWIHGKEHPWAASTANFPIFWEDNLLPQLKEDDMYRYPEFYIGPYPPCDPLRVTHDMLIAQELFMDSGAIGMGFRVEAVNSGSLTMNGEPVVPGKTMIRYGESVVWTPPARVNSAGESGGADVFDAFTIRAADGATVSDNSVTITIAADSAGELDAVDDTVEIDEDAENVIIDVLANDSGNGTLVVTGVGQPQRGVVLLVKGQVSYTPGSNFHGSDQFTYSVTDSTQNTGTATVTVIVRSVNDPPEAYDDHLTVVMDSVNNTIDVLVNDYDVDPDPLTALPGNSPAHGSVIPNADGIFSYTPDASYIGSDSFTYFADDGTDQRMATVLITVVEAADSDWGDAPEFSGSMGGGYPTRAANGGANHTIGGSWLGAMAPDGEADGHPDSAAMGDDNNNIDDEDGISIPGLQQGKTATIEIVVGGGGGYVDAWIDWNGNHLWEHPQEQIHAGHLPDGTHTIPVSVPDASITGHTFARFRISSDGGLTPRGPAPDGEVEDYGVQIQTSRGCGDLNGDGEVTAADAVIALEIAAGSHPFDPAADVSGDAKVTSLDALMILQVAAGQIEIC